MATKAEQFARDQLKAIIERIERLHEERKSLSDDVRDVYLEAKGNGFDVKAIKTIIRIRAQDPGEAREQDAIVATYMAALGMTLDLGTPLANEESRPPARGDEQSSGPKRDRHKAQDRMRSAREEIFRDLEDRGILPSTDTAKTVYFLHAPAAGLIKIGCSDNIRARLTNLAVSSPVPLTLLGIVSGGRAREFELHKKFEALRVRGEWFSDENGEIAALVSALCPREWVESDQLDDSTSTPETAPSVTEADGDGIPAFLDRRNPSGASANTS